MADDFVELHGDRLFGDDEAIVAGFATIGGHKVAVVGQQKGADTEENLRRSFGMPHPEGYRKAMRVMELAERSGLPVVTFVDVPGAHPARIGGARHRRGDRPEHRPHDPPAHPDRHGHHRRGWLRRRARDRRRGCRAGARERVYSVISPEGCASILWRRATRRRPRRWR
jgi:acetyl-CoA carboxylase alpha subunit